MSEAQDPDASTSSRIGTLDVDVLVLSPSSLNVRVSVHVIVKIRLPLQKNHLGRDTIIQSYLRTVNTKKTVQHYDGSYNPAGPGVIRFQLDNSFRWVGFCRAPNCLFFVLTHLCVCAFIVFCFARSRFRKKEVKVEVFAVHNSTLVESRYAIESNHWSCLSIQNEIIRRFAHVVVIVVAVVTHSIAWARERSKSKAKQQLEKEMEAVRDKPVMLLTHTCCP